MIHLSSSPARISHDAKDLKIDGEAHTKQASKLKKKSLMDTINKLSSTVTSTDGTITKIFDTMTNGNEVK